MHGIKSTDHLILTFTAMRVKTYDFFKLTIVARQCNLKYTPNFEDWRFKCTALRKPHSETLNSLTNQSVCRRLYITRTWIKRKVFRHLCIFTITSICAISSASEHISNNSILICIGTAKAPDRTKQLPICVHGGLPLFFENSIPYQLETADHDISK